MKAKRSATGGEIGGDTWQIKGPRLGVRHVALLQSARWMGKSANTRLPALLMVAGYPATLIGVWFPPLLMIGGTILAGLVIWHVSYRSVVHAGEHASKAKLSAATDWSLRVGALAPAYLTWTLLVRWHMTRTGGLASHLDALFGAIFSTGWFLGYAAASVTLWLAIFRAPHVVTCHAARVAGGKHPFTADIDMDGVRVVRQGPTRTGIRYILDVTKSGRAVSDFVGGKFAERLAGKLGLPLGRIVMRPVGAHAGRLEVSVRQIDPWADPIPHPAAPEYPSGRTRITDPIVIGMDPEQGKPLCVELANKEGGQHHVVIAMTRGGKTTLVNSVIEYLTRPEPGSRDTDIAMIDVTKGKDGRAWAPAIAEAHMGPEATEAALECLERHAALIAARARSNSHAVWKAGTDPARRAKLVILDEASELLASTEQEIANRAKKAVAYILSKGASEMVVILVMAQRGVLTHLGTGDVKANTFVKILLGVTSRAEMNFALPGWEDRGIPDMSVYGEGKKGVLLIAPTASPWSAGRSYDLSDLDTVREIARKRSLRDPAHQALADAEQVIEDAQAVIKGDLLREPPDDGIDDPDSADATPWGTPPAGVVEPAVPLPRPPTARERRLMGWGNPASAGGGWMPPAPDPVQAVKQAQQAAAGAVATIDRALAAEMARPLQESARRWADRQLATAKADQAEHVPAEFAAAVLRLTRGATGGITRAQVEEVTGRSKAGCASYLRIMTNQGALVASGAGPSRRYHASTATSNGK